ncbi:MAG: STAS domain-containing protein [Nitrospinaceae bacterium]
MGIELQSDQVANGTVTVKIKGEIDMSTSSQVRDYLGHYFKENQKVVVVDLSDVSYIDSSGIATLVEGLQWSHSCKKKFRLTGLSPMVKDVFEIARLLTVFDIYDSKEEAIEGV